MNDFQKSVGSRDKSEDWSIPPVERLEKEKKGKEEFSKATYLSSSSQLALFESFVLFFKKILGLFSSQDKIESDLLDQQQILEDLFAFRKMLQILANEDQSHNPEFTQQLSELWHNLLDDCKQMEIVLKEHPQTISKIKLLVNKISAFPATEDHPLGYYLEEYAGKQWLPFPFLDILHQLHQQSQEASETSELHNWISLLDELISTLDIKADLQS